MECMEGISMIMVGAFGGENSHRISGVVVPFLMYVVTPCTYILNRETTKQIIVFENWFKAVKSTFMTPQEAQAEVERLQGERQNVVMNN